MLKTAHSALNTTQPAFSLIEIIVAVAFISVILTALSMTLLYTNRALKENEYRSQATNQAQSCLDVFRNLRDSNSWAFFCQRLTTLNASNVNGHNLPKITSVVNGGLLLTICQANSSQIGNTYDFSISNLDNPPSNYTASNMCNDNQRVRISVTVNYDNFHGDRQSLTLTQDFAKRETEADY